MDLLEIQLEGLIQIRDTLQEDKYGLLSLTDVKYMLSTLNSHISCLKMMAENGINIPESKRGHLTGHYLSLGEFTSLSRYGPDLDNKSISYPDDGNAYPSEGWYYVVSFPCGPYSLIEYSGEGIYPEGTFEKMFNELKEYGPTHSDTNNSYLYFKLDGSTRVGELDKNFREILNKYKSLVHEEVKAIRVRKMEQDLARLKEE